ncbi:hypothetical protein [Phenylobacterium sp.]|jgi:hypothetical protein|uniref:hypothetical protein n=1 Tax=Phenylobacterium sp. TaxID=1871053 RepID=UPI002F93F867
MFDPVAAALASAGLAALSLAWFGVLLAWHGLHARSETRRAAQRAEAEALLDAMETGRASAAEAVAALRRRPAVLAEALATRRVGGPAAARLASAVESAGLAEVLRRRAERARGPARLVAIDALGALPGPETARVLRRIWFYGRGEARIAALQALEEFGRPLPLGAVLRSLDHDDVVASRRLIALLEVLVRGRPETAARLAHSGKLTLRTRAALQQAIDRAACPAGRRARRATRPRVAA